MDWGNEYFKIYSLIWVDCWNTGVCIEKETKMPHKQDWAHPSVPARGQVSDVRQSVHLDAEKLNNVLTMESLFIHQEEWDIKMAKKQI